MTSKEKSNVGELAVAADLAKKGYRVALPFGEYGDWDLVFERPTGELERVQVKYTESDGKVVKVRGRCHSVTAGRVGKTKMYDCSMVEWIAVYDKTTDAVYYVDPSELGSSGEVQLRLVPPANGMTKGIRWAHEYKRRIVMPASSR